MVRIWFPMTFYMERASNDKMTDRLEEKSFDISDICQFYSRHKCQILTDSNQPVNQDNRVGDFDGLLATHLMYLANALNILPDAQIGLIRPGAQ